MWHLSNTHIFAFLLLPFSIEAKYKIVQKELSCWYGDKYLVTLDCFHSVRNGENYYSAIANIKPNVSIDNVFVNGKCLRFPKWPMNNNVLYSNCSSSSQLSARNWMASSSRSLPVWRTLKWMCVNILAVNMRQRSVMLFSNRARQTAIYVVRSE